MQQRCILTLGRDQRPQARRNRESDAAFANVIDELVVLIRVSRNLIEPFHKLVVGQRPALLKLSWRRERTTISLRINGAEPGCSNRKKKSQTNAAKRGNGKTRRSFQARPHEISATNYNV